MLILKRGTHVVFRRFSGGRQDSREIIEKDIDDERDGHAKLHVSASIRHHTAAYVSLRASERDGHAQMHVSASTRQYRIRQDTTAYDRIVQR